MSPIPLNVPNALGLVRVASSPALLVLAALDRRLLFLALFLVLEATDWLDGKLAVGLDQRTAFGSRLDTVADFAMYAGLLAGLVFLEGDRFLGEWPWMAPALSGYAVSWAFSLWKFGVLPSYHARSAKVSWLLALLAAVALLLLELIWPVRVAAVAVTVANLEAVLLTWKLERPRSDVPSFLGL